VSWKPIDAFTIDAIVKKAGSVVNATRLVVSRDGKALTITEKERVRMDARHMESESTRSDKGLGPPAV
jgi:hypothetical protein